MVGRDEDDRGGGLRAEPVEQPAELRVDERDLAVVRPAARSAWRRAPAARTARAGRSSGPTRRTARSPRRASAGRRRSWPRRPARRRGRAARRGRAGSGRRTRRSRARSRSAGRAGTPTRTRPCGTRRRGRPRPRTGRPRAARSRRCRGHRAAPGTRPVRIEAWDGPVSGAGATARLEPHAPAGERVEDGRRGIRPAVAAERVGAQRVDGDEEDARLGRAGRAGRGRRWRGPAGHGEREQREEAGRERPGRRARRARRGRGPGRPGHGQRPSAATRVNGSRVVTSRPLSSSLAVSTSS